MANISTIVEDWLIDSPAEDPAIRVLVIHHTEMGNLAMPGLQVHCADSMVDYEPVITELWAHAAKKMGITEYLLEFLSWKEYAGTHIKFYLLMGDTPKARVAVKVSSNDTPIIREYELPFTLAS